jgi:hypothetical protein
MATVLEYISCSSKEYDEVAALIRETCPDECIVSIDKVKNPILEAEFEKTKTAIATKRGWETCPEKIVFHGTSEEGMWAIASHGFSLAKCKTCAYGVGTYCSTSASVARGYAKQTTLGDNALLVCKAVWGKPGTVTGSLAIDTNKIDLSLTKYGEWVAAAIPYEFGIIPVYAVQFYARAVNSEKKMARTVATGAKKVANATK